MVMNSTGCMHNILSYESVFHERVAPSDIVTAPWPALFSFPAAPQGVQTWIHSNSCLAKPYNSLHKPIKHVTIITILHMNSLH